MYGRHRASDITLVDPLEERGLLKVLEPADWIDEEMANKLAEIVLGLLRGGAFEDLPNAPYFAELSRSRMGYAVDVELAGSLVDELKAAGLARPSEDGVSIPLHPTVRTTILVVLGQLSRTAGAKRGMECHPTTSSRQAISKLVRTLSREGRAFDQQGNPTGPRTRRLRLGKRSLGRCSPVPSGAQGYPQGLHARSSGIHG